VVVFGVLQGRRGAGVAGLLLERLAVGGHAVGPAFLLVRRRPEGHLLLILGLRVRRRRLEGVLGVLQTLRRRRVVGIQFQGVLVGLDGVGVLLGVHGRLGLRHVLVEVLLFLRLGAAGVLAGLGVLLQRQGRRVVGDQFERVVGVLDGIVKLLG